MKKFRILIYLNLMLYVLSSCGAIKGGLTNQNKNSSDEFLVEKKSPLVMPPNFNDLPTPETENIDKNLDNSSIKDLIKDSGNENIPDDKNNSVESSIIDKIKSN